MRITVKFRGPIAQRIEGGLLEIEEEENTKLRELLIALIREQDYLRETWKTPEEMDRDAMILLNGIDIGLTGGLETKPSNGDVLTVLPLVHGG
jgi:molybdopterin converting factor small subunit